MLLVGLVLVAIRGRASIPTEREPDSTEDEPSSDDEWAPHPMMMQAGPLIAVVALELLFARDLLDGIF